MAETTRIPTLNLAGGWETMLEGKAREQLERSVLPEFLRAQRWFGGKGRRLASLRFADWGDFPAPQSRVFLVLLEVGFSDGQSDRYFFPLGVTRGDSAERIASSAPSLLIARLSGPRDGALLHDALADEETCLSLLAAVGANAEFATRDGQVRAFATSAFTELRGEAEQPLPVTRGPATSSNSLIFYGQRLLMKLFRRLESGINPDFEIGRFLTEGRLFQRLPWVAGAIEYHRSGSEPITLALLQSFVVNQGDAWQHALDELGRYYQRVSVHTSPGDTSAPDHRPLLQLAESVAPPAVEAVIGGYLGAAGKLGRRTAEMHHALSADPNNADFAPEPFTPWDSTALRGRIRTRGESALAALSDNLDQLPPDLAPSARRLLEEGPQLLRRMTEGPPFRANAAKIRCHGDYHLGQVLRVEDDYVILDFEGEPMRTVAERRAKQSPLKDVAGMLRSYHIAAYAGLFAFSAKQPGALGRLQPWAELWSRWSSAAFLCAYRDAARGAAFVPADPAAFAELLNAFRLEKMFYELHYELNNRPDWIHIPLRHILIMLDTNTP
jgi:maltose alpha-D-glucosyltransferase / alpha-amylase